MQQQRLDIERVMLDSIVDCQELRCGIFVLECTDSDTGVKTFNSQHVGICLGRYVSNIYLQYHRFLSLIKIKNIDGNNSRFYK